MDSPGKFSGYRNDGFDSTKVSEKLLLKQQQTNLPTTEQDLKKQIQQMEHQIDNKIGAFASLNERIDSNNRANSSEEIFRELEFSLNEHVDELEMLLKRFGELIQSLSQKSQSLNVGLMQHYRSKYDEFNHEFRRLKRNTYESWERSQLLRSKKFEPLPDRNINIDNLVRERGSIHSSASIADEVLGQAENARSQLNLQSRTLQGARNTISGLTTQIPSLGNIMGKITAKKNRNNVILGLFIALCTCFLIWYWLRS